MGPETPEKPPPEKTASVVGEEAAPSWQYLLNGLWASALRLEEAMHVSWDDPTYITPQWRKGRLPVLRIPATMQKNVTEEEIPLLPWFEQLLLETPEADRTGWVFRPASLNTQHGRKPVVERPLADWVGKVIAAIGEAAGVIVEPARGTPPPPPAVAKGKKPKPPRRCKGYVPAKYASAHDLRRSCADRMEAAGVPLEVVSRVLRHASMETTRRHYAPGNVQRDAGLLREKLGTVLGTATRLEAEEVT